MNKMRRFPAVLLALSMLMTAALTGCSKTEIAGPDEVAVALFDLFVRNDAAAAQKALGYDSEEAVREDFGANDDMYDAVAEELVGELESMLGATAPTEDVRYFVDAMVGMLSKVEFTAEVKEQNKDTAVVTCTVSKLDTSTVMNSMEDTVMELISGGASDPTEMLSGLLRALADGFSSLEPSGETSTFDVDFVLEAMEISGKAQKVWIPEDAGAFGEAISTTVLAG